MKKERLREREIVRKRAKEIEICMLDEVRWGDREKEREKDKSTDPAVVVVAVPVVDGVELGEGNTAHQHRLSAHTRFNKQNS